MSTANKGLWFHDMQYQYSSPGFFTTLNAIMDQQITKVPLSKESIARFWFELLLEHPAPLYNGTKFLDMLERTSIDYNALKREFEKLRNDAYARSVRNQSFFKITTFGGMGYSALVYYPPLCKFPAIWWYDPNGVTNNADWLGDVRYIDHNRKMIHGAKHVERITKDIAKAIKMNFMANAAFG